MSDEGSGDNHAGGGGFLGGANKLLLGLTGLVAALGALLTTCDKVFPDEPANAQSATSNTQGEGKADQPAQQSVEEEGNPVLYTGENLRMEWTGKQWKLSSSDGVFLYDEMLATEGNWVLGFNKAQDEYIRWPLDGGTMEYSVDDRKSWISYGEVQPASE